MTIVETYKPKIGLCMIVKNESHIIERCLNSVLPLIDFVLIEDTGSTDGTQQLIRTWLERNQVTGAVHDNPWVNFAHNRSSALARLRQHSQIDYALVMDADDVLLIDDLPRVVSHLCKHTADAYKIAITGQGVDYWRTQLVSNRQAFHYVGVLHEYIEGPQGHKTQQLPGLRIQSNREGARSQDPDKYKKDAALLSEALITEKDPFLRTRYTFYLAQSLRDSGQAEAAIQTYLARSVMGRWAQESYVALLCAGRLMAQLNYPHDEIAATLRRAFDYAPDRLEAHQVLCRQLRLQGKFQEALDLGLPHLNKLQPKEGLFVEPWVYTRGLKDEMAVSAYWVGNNELCLDLCSELLKLSDLPAEDRIRIIKNGKAAFARLHAKAKAFTELATRVPSVRGLGKPQGGTELMVEGLLSRLQYDKSKIHLAINTYDMRLAEGKYLVVWIHHDFNQAAVQWLKEPNRRERVDRFVFVSEWQQQRFIEQFQIDRTRSVVLQNASASMQAPRVPQPGPFKLVYASTPFRGLDILLDTWESIGPSLQGKAELHVFSSMKLYAQEDSRYQHLIDKARGLEGCHYHGVLPNTELKQFMLGCHVLAYPSTFEETSCLAAIDAMTCGLRVVAPAYGALPETCGQFARLYPWTADRVQHQKRFTHELLQEINNPWDGDLSKRMQQLHHCAAQFDWEVRVQAWQKLLHPPLF